MVCPLEKDCKASPCLAQVMEAKSGRNQSKRTKTRHPLFVLPQSPDRVLNTAGAFAICTNDNFMMTTWVYIQGYSPGVIHRSHFLFGNRYKWMIRNPGIKTGVHFVGFLMLTNVTKEKNS